MRRLTLPPSTVAAAAMLAALFADGFVGASVRHRAVRSAPRDPRSILVRPRVAEAENAPRWRGARLDLHRNSPGTPAHAREPRFQRFELPPGVSVDQALREIAETQPELEAIPNLRYHTLRTPNDPRFTQSWGLANTAQTVNAISPFQLEPGNPGTSGMDIGAEAAWDFQSDCSSVVLGVIDTGVAYDHEDLAPNMWTDPSYPNHGFDFVDNDNDPYDLDGHGTHIAGIAGAAGDNAVGSAGLCWNLQIMAVRVLDATGSGTTSDVVSGVDFAVAHGAKVINLSLGASAEDPALTAAIHDAEAADVVVVMAAGNDGANNDDPSSPTYPCNSGGAASLCVAALEQSFDLASFSNYGATNVDVGAPGSNVLSSWNGAVTDISPDMTSGWTFVNAGSAPFGWDYVVANLVGGGTLPALANPKNYLVGAQNPTYAASSTDRVYRNLDAGNSGVAKLSWTGAIDTYATDFLRVRCAPAGGDPFSPAGSLVYSQSVTGGTTLNYVEVEVPAACRTSTATFGYQMESDATNQKRGLFVADVLLEKTALGTASYAVISGTSQATPHVSGIAALVRSFRPTASAMRVAEAIRNGGRPVAALAGKTVSGKAVHALGALSYLAAPTNVTVQLQ